VCGQPHSPAALPPGKTRFSLYRRLGGPQSWFGRVRKISPPPGCDPWTVQSLASRYTDWAIPAHMPYMLVYSVTCQLVKCFHQLWKVVISFIMCGHLSVRLYWTTQLLLDGFSWNFFYWRLVLKSVTKMQFWLEIRHIIRYAHEYLSTFLMLITFVLSVCPHVATQLPMARIFVKFYIGDCY